jgi:uncharacterized protein (TIGR02996 family)
MSLEAVETDLLAAIAADPDALEPRLIYADWLQARDDPRGELIVVQAGRLARPDDVQLEERERELTTELTNALVLRAGPKTVTTALIKRWHLGFVDKIAVDARTIRLLRTTLREWCARPELAVVRELDIDSKYARDLRFIRHLGLTKTVRRVRFGDWRTLMEEPTIEAIARRLPNLTALVLRTTHVPPLQALRPLRLRALELELQELTDDGFRRIAEVPWTLETFGLRTTAQFADDRVPLLAQLYDGTTLGSVKHFVISGTVPVVDIIETLATSKRAATVETFTADFYRTPNDQLTRLERHREALAKVTFAPLLQDSAYYDADNCQKVGSLLNYRLDRPADALVPYQRGLRIRPEDSTLRHNLGVALRKLKRFDESLVAFDTIINATKAPTASMFNGRHYTLCELGRRAEARADLERAVWIDPNFADGWNNLGVERQYIGDANDALDAFRRCMQLDPEHNYALRNEADLLLELGRAAEALPIYERLVPTKPGDRSLFAMIAHAQVELGDAAAARATLDARFADPQQENHQRLYVLRALALRDLREDPCPDLDECARITDCPAWFAMTVFVRALDNLASWTAMVPDTAVTPRTIADAVVAYAKTTRPALATAMHDPGDDDQLDCAELAVGAALLARDRDLAVARAHAAAALYAEQGPRYFRKWWQMLATVMVIANRGLDDEARALLALVLRAVRGRARIADVMALVP